MDGITELTDDIILELAGRDETPGEKLLARAAVHFGQKAGEMTPNEAKLFRVCAGSIGNDDVKEVLRRRQFDREAHEPTG